MREIVLHRIRKLREIWPDRLNAFSTMVEKPKMSWDQLDDMSDQDLIYIFERLTRATCYDSVGSLVEVSVWANRTPNEL